VIRKRLIPRILIQEVNNSFVAILSKSFKLASIAGDPISQFKIMEANMADEISIIHKQAKHASLNINFFQLLKDIVRVSSTPICAGGGIKSIEDVHNFMKIGIEKVVIPVSEKFDNLEIIKLACNKFGRQSVQVSIDYIEVNNQYFIYKSHTELGIDDLINIASKYILAGAGEVVLTNVLRDGSKAGLDLKLIKGFTQSLSVPVIVSGGANSQSNFAEALLLGAEGVISGTYFAKKDHSLMQLRSSIVSSGLSVRKLT
jgi:cyclase